MRLRARAGQTATEYMLVISVIVCSLVAAAYLFIPEFQGGVAELASDVRVALATGQVGGIGFDRGGSGNASHAPGGGATGLGHGGTASTPGADGPSFSPSSAASQGLDSSSTASSLGRSPAARQNANDGTPTLTNINNGPNSVQPVLNHGVYHSDDPNQPVLNHGVYHGAPPPVRTTLST